jgi:hypothetical protein
MDMKRKMEIRKNLPKITQTYLRLRATEEREDRWLDRIERQAEHADGEQARVMENLRSEAESLAELAQMGVTFGAPVKPSETGCTGCVWHAENTTEDRSDGGVASALLSWVREGYLGDPKNVVLHPCNASD